jgi:hypothetical protein
MGLQDKLNARKIQFEAEAPPEALEVMHRATNDLRQSGILDRVLKEGALAPDFSLSDSQGRMVQAKELLEKGPIVLSFYRGAW